MIQKQSVSWQHIFSIVGFGLLLTIPVIINGCLNAHDFYYHLVYGKYFSEQFWQGEFYPRWLQNMNSGLGSPTFFFYAPIPYYFTSLFSPLFHYNTLSCKELGLSSSLALVASGLTAYFWLKEIVPKNSAAIASILYMAWPYHLFFDLYTRLAFAEYWSFVWIPLILYFSKKIVKDSRLNIIGLAISLALLVLTHLPTFIIFFPVSVGYAIFIASRNQWKIVSVRLSIAIIIAIGLSAIYWLPAMTTQESISMDVLTDYYYYANNFLFRGIGHSTSPDNFLSLLELSTALTGGLAFCAWKISKIYSEVTSSSRRESNFWMIVAMLSLFMMLPLSKFIWDVLPVVQKIQFPWRFNTVLTVATVGLFALAISQLKINYNFSNNLNKNFLFRIIILAALAFILTTIQILPLILPLKEKIVFWGSLKTVLSLSLIAFLLLGISFIRKPINFSNHKFLSAGFLLTLTIFLGSLSFSFKKIFFTRINFNDSPYIQASKGADEHRPRWVPKEVFNPKDLTRLSEKFPIIQIDAGKASWLIRQWQPRRIVLQINAITDTEFTIHQFYYPGWTAKLKGSSQSLPVHFSELGLLQISVPTGKHEVSLTLDAVIEERIGQIISVVSAVLTLYLVFLLRRDCNSMQNNKCMHRTD
jgi:hypothetical protein